jgi:hypothetical protein
VIDKEADFLVCSRADSGNSPWIKGSKILFCKNCASPTWVSPSGLKMLDEKELILICTICAGEFARQREEDGMPPIEVAPPTAEQIKELKDAS